MHIEGCQLSQIIQGTQDFGPYLPQPCLMGSLLPFLMERERERDPGLVWSHGSRTNLKIKFIFAEPSK